MKTLDIENLEDLGSYLRDRELAGASEDLSLRKLDGGVSNRTVLVSLAERGDAWVVKQALPRLRVEAEWYSGTERVHREALGLRWLLRLLPEGTVPPFVFEDFDHHLLIMEAVREPHHNWKTKLLEGEVRFAQVEQFGHLLATLHRLAVRHETELAEPFADKRFFRELRLEPYYSYAASRVPRAQDFITQLSNETEARSDTLVHGDYSPKNVLVHGERLVLLDHEVMHLGDPAFDLGFGLTHLLSKGHHLARYRSTFREAARIFWSSYCTTLGAQGDIASLEARTTRHALACMLARVEGRSPLEYLRERERAYQKRLVLELMAVTPASVPELIEDFLGGLQ